MTPLLMALGLLMAAAPAHPTKQISAAEVARRLDVMSFPNSIQPARRPGAHKLRDYGFTKPASVGRDTVTLYQHRDGRVRWLFGIDILRRHGRRLTLCITDKAVSEGNYYYVYPIEVQEGADGVLRATRQRVTEPRCRAEQFNAPNAPRR